jgi:hypothetical protein
MKTFHFILQISRGLILTAQARRAMMFYSLLLALFLVFAGSSFLSSTLGRHPWIFICYWGGTAWLTLLAVLLAFYDLLSVRRAATLERRQLARDLQMRKSNRESHDPDPR